jgi:RNase P protein component
VKRRLRAAAAVRLSCLDPGCAVVVRALPAAARTDFWRLSADLDRVLGGLGALTGNGESK